MYVMMKFYIRSMVWDHQIDGINSTFSTAVILAPQKLICNESFLTWPSSRLELSIIMSKMENWKWKLSSPTYFKMKQKRAWFECGKINPTILLYWLMRTGQVQQGQTIQITQQILSSIIMTKLGGCHHLRKLEVCF